jgi:hypothetical protein
MAHRFSTANGKQVTSAWLNSLDRGGNVYPSEVGGLKVDVSGFRYHDQTSAEVQEFADVTEQSLTGSATNYVYVDDGGALVVSTDGFPDGGGSPARAREDHIPLAVVTTSGNSVTDIEDARPAMSLQRGAIELADPGDGEDLPLAGWTRAILPLEIGSGTETNPAIGNADHVDQELVVCVASAGGGTRELTFADDIHGTTSGNKWKATGIRAYGVFRADANRKWVMVANFGGVLS